ncbi:unnamed protein product [Lymnaea stagnalis]|uniref:RGS domain-containing protein n=1 Tax=Lymnaea stagnalis TaxID=6523 RepID=A0AAV2HKX3_LYMST
MPLFRRKTSDRQVKSPSTSSGLIRTPSNKSSKSLPHSPSTPDSWGEESDIGSSYSVFNGSIPWERRPRTLMLSEEVLKDGADIPENSLESPMRSTSRLSKTLIEVIRDKDALSCFKSFMKSQSAEHIIQFWCEAESFHVSTLMRLRTQSLQNISKSALHKRRSDSFRHGNSDACLASSPDATVLYCGSSTPLDTDLAVHSIPPPRNTEQNQNRSILATPTDLLNQVPPDVKNSLPTPKQYSNSPIPDNTNQTNHQSLTAPTNLNVTDQPNHTTCMPSDDTVTSSKISASTICDKNVVKSLSFSAHDSETFGCDYSESTKAASLTQLSKTVGSENIPTETEFATPVEVSQEDIANKLKKSIERDAVTIFSTYIAKDSPKPIGVDDTLRAEAISKICQENGEVDPECFASCQRFVLNKLESEYYQPFKDSEFHCRHQVNVLTTEKVFLPDILFNENALCYFMEFMEQEGASDLMQMWLAAENFQQQLLSTSGSYDGEQAQIDAMVLYDRYFSLQATNPVGFDDKMRFEIEGNICREGGPLPGCFTKAKNIVLKIIDKVYFSNYLQSQVYYRYLSDLICTVQMSEDMPSKSFQKGHKRSESDASSEHSVGSHSTGAESVVSRNTLLAVDTRKLRKGSTIEGDFSMNMDMLNPDDLWKRPVAKLDSSSNLTLGCVNELGQFVSHFEHDAEAEKKKGPLLFKRRKEKEKEEEEMALRIAQMIISDVNTMTKTGESMNKKNGS